MTADQTLDPTAPMRTQAMSVGVYVDAHPGIATQARALEDAGFSHLWVYDSPLVFSDPWMALALAAEGTSRIALGPGVTHPRARDAHATAQAAGTLARIAGDRVVVGLGIGNSARRSLGMPPVRLDELTRYALDLRSLLTGGTAELTEGGRRHDVAFIHPEGRWLDLGTSTGIWTSAFGPRGQELAATYADGVLVRWEGAEALDVVRHRLGDAAEAAGRPRDVVQIGVVFAVYPVESDAELDGPEVREALGPLVVSRLRYLTANHRDPEEVPAAFRDGFRAYVEHRDGLDEHRRHLDNYLGYLTFVPPHLEHFVTPASMRTVCHVGTADEVVAELDRMRRAGVDHVSLQVAGPPATWIDRMGRDVLPRVARL